MKIKNDKCYAHLYSASLSKFSRYASLLIMLFLSKDINECESSPCVHGSCMDQVNRYVCECTPGYIGVSCDTGEKTNCLVYA